MNLKKITPEEREAFITKIQALDINAVSVRFSGRKVHVDNQYYSVREIFDCATSWYNENKNKTDISSKETRLKLLEKIKELSETEASGKFGKIWLWVVRIFSKEFSKNYKNSLDKLIDDATPVSIKKNINERPDNLQSLNTWYSKVLTDIEQKDEYLENLKSLITKTQETLSNKEKNVNKLYKNKNTDGIDNNEKLLELLKETKALTESLTDLKKEEEDLNNLKSSTTNTLNDTDDIETPEETLNNRKKHYEDIKSEEIEKWDCSEAIEKLPDEWKHEHHGFIIKETSENWDKPELLFKELDIPTTGRHVLVCLFKEDCSSCYTMNKEDLYGPGVFLYIYENGRYKGGGTLGKVSKEGEIFFPMFIGKEIKKPGDLIDLYNESISVPNKLKPVPMSGLDSGPYIPEAIRENANYAGIHASIANFRQKYSKIDDYYIFYSSIDNSFVLALPKDNIALNVIRRDNDKDLFKISTRNVITTATDLNVILIHAKNTVKSSL